MRVLVVNAGSSSLRLRSLDDDRLIAGHDLPALREIDDGDLAAALDDLPVPEAIGHRIVHGGARYAGPVRLDASVREDLRALTSLAPLHEPPALEAEAVVTRAFPDVPAAACFDTAFHANLPAEAATYALPRPWRERWPLRRFGFHGLSHAHVARRCADMLGRPAPVLRIVSCHLGSGASVCAIAGGCSVDTTMGFTPLEGLVMATRSGDVDPGLLLWLLEQPGMDAAGLSRALYEESGLLGLAGSADMREVLDRAAAGDADPILALDVYVHRLRAAIAAMAVAMGGLDVLAFTGGVGENAPDVRARAAAGLGLLGVAVDEERNAAARADADIGRTGASVQTLVVEAREDLEIAREVRRLLAPAA